MSAACDCRSSSVIFVSVVGLQKRTQMPVKLYMYIIAVKRSDGLEYEITRSYADFLRLDAKVRHVIKETALNKATAKTTLPKRLPASRSGVDHFKKASSKMATLATYCNALVSLNIPALTNLTLSFFRHDRCQGNAACKLSEIGSALSCAQEMQISLPMSLPLCKVLVAFEANDKSKISLKENQTVKVVEKNTSGWWFVEDDKKKQGWFPASYLESIDDAYDNEESTVLKIAESFRAIRGYEGQRGDEISFCEGDILTVIDKRRDGWWIVKRNGVTGFAPAIHLKANNSEDRIEHMDNSSEGLNSSNKRRNGVIGVAPVMYAFPYSMNQGDISTISYPSGISTGRKSILQEAHDIPTTLLRMSSSQQNFNISDCIIDMDGSRIMKSAKSCTDLKRVSQDPASCDSSSSGRSSPNESLSDESMKSEIFSQRRPFKTGSNPHGDLTSCYESSPDESPCVGSLSNLALQSPQDETRMHVDFRHSLLKFQKVSHRSSTSEMQGTNNVAYCATESDTKL